MKDRPRLRPENEVRMKGIRTLGAIALFAILAAAALACSGAPEATRMGTEGAYPPYNFINDAGEVGRVRA